ncbi:sensor histidine kinase [Mucilaginibacter sp. E4BP6]|uniref:sensor histidine kinase n=1 Tax=Mucilaginibacter sp. E4BP6 TaxID=2723089 RepID=UPI0015CCF197|nr:sensor histidine kinase [Mucilaginibacter sp. E4BP6]NYE66913.1 signal transduction histidine kinase [Mucilaginibacter sp. E4BP6]
MGGKLKWRFDASTFKLLGRGLITDRITAIYELVKNCYDANSTKVELDFLNVENRGSKSIIIIRDNGSGMSLQDITDKWLVVGTSSKRGKTFSDPPFNRRYIGEKGVGRFATDKLGGHLQIYTKRKNDSDTLKVTINWSEYENQVTQNGANNQQKLFTELENDYEYIGDNGLFDDGHGTQLEITMLHEAWDKEMLLRLENQLGRILPTLFKLDPPFDIFLEAESLEMEKRKVVPEPIENLATVHVSATFDYKKHQQGVVHFDEEKQEFVPYYVEPEIFGPISMDFYYFNADAQTQFKAKYKNTSNYIEGVKIYRDGVISTPFAEYESVLDKRRDILGIDKRRFQEAFDKLSTRQFIGIIHITRDGNPAILDATNRQDFDDTPEYRRLKEFVIEQIDELAKYRAVKRKENKVRVQNNLRRASADVKDVSKTLNRIIKERPELKNVLAPAVAKAKDASDKVTEGVKETETSEQEFLRKEELYLSLMSLQDFANELAHGIRFALAPAKQGAEYIVEFFPDPRKNDKFHEYARLIYSQTEVISTLVDFMLSYAQVDLEDSDFSVKDVINSVLKGAHEIIFEKEGIAVNIDIKENIQLTGKRKFLEDVLSNLISNSRKALAKESEKKILCESYVDSDKLTIIFSDNGTGVDPKIRDKMFEMFKTTTAEEGGAGLGLFIARSRMKALNGSIELVNSVFAPKGASFKLTLPLKK